MQNLRKTKNQPKSKNDFEDLKCSLCKKYLSMPPIFTSANGKINKCGRCVEADQVENEPWDDENLRRNETYEKLAKHMQFPCSQSKNCKEILSWEDVSNHENVCPFRQIMCPHQTCSQIYEISSIHSHFNNRHRVHSGNVISYNFVCETGNINILLIKTNNNAQFLACFLMDEVFLRVNVYKLTSTETDHNFTVRFTSSSCSVNYISHYDICTYPGTQCTEINSPLLNSFISIKRESLLDTLNVALSSNKISLDITLEIFKKDPSVPIKQYLSAFSCCKDIVFRAIECPICYVPMTSNIYLCPLGHSLCNNCKLRTNSCPSCRTSLSSYVGYTNSRNYALEALYQKLAAIHAPP